MTQPIAAVHVETEPAETGERPRRRDTVPVPPSATGTELALAYTNFVAPPRSMADATSESTQEISDGDILASTTDRGWFADGADESGDTMASLSQPGAPPAGSGERPFFPDEADDVGTSPTLSLANQSHSSREVYRLFLASEYAPALALANGLIGQGDEDPMLVTIARECRTTLSSIPEPMVRPDSRDDARAMTFDASMTIAQVAAMTGVPVSEVIGVLDRFVSLGLSRRSRS